MRSGTHGYEIVLDGGTVKLGVVNSPRTTKTLLAEGGAASEATWSRFAEVVRQQERK
jgi:hypothetical protein